MNTRSKVNLGFEPPRVLLLTSQYFLLGQIEDACKRLEVPHYLLDLKTKAMDLDEFVTLISSTIAVFKPDLVLTVNHLGVDREGVLTEILHKLNIPLASWFVDNPHLILRAYNNLHPGNTTLFTWDADNLSMLEEQGFKGVHHLPLGADPDRFKPTGREIPEEWKARVSFVGNSMKAKCEARFRVANPGFNLVADAFDVAEDFIESDERTADEFIARKYPHLVADLEAMEPKRRLAYETYITWLSTCIYRRNCIRKLMDFDLLIVGDKGWTELFKHCEGWRHLKELSYYDDLPDFYGASEINFNCTSKQMKGAVNQRVFDVPCAGGFLLTDYREQMENLFELGTEVVVYRDKEEIPELVQRYLDAPEERAKVTEAAKKRIMAEHTYDHRMRDLLKIMREGIA